jgi:hypothetical protein
MAVTKEQLGKVIDDINNFADPQIKVSSKATLEVFTKLVTVYAPMFGSKLSAESVTTCADAGISIDPPEVAQPEEPNETPVESPMTAADYAKAKARETGKPTLATQKDAKKPVKVKEPKPAPGPRKPTLRAERVVFQMDMIEKGTTFKELADATQAKYPDLKISTILTEIRDGKNPKYCHYPKLIVIEKDTGKLSLTEKPE